METVYLDVMIADRFYCQLTYKFCPLFPINSDELKNFIVEKRPSLRNKKFKIEFSKNKV